MDVVDYWRIVNSLISAVALVYIMLDLRSRRNEVSQRQIYLTLSLAGLLAGVLISGFFYTAINAPAHIHTAFYTAASIWCIMGIWISRGDPT